MTIGACRFQTGLVERCVFPAESSVGAVQLLLRGVLFSRRHLFYKCHVINEVDLGGQKIVVCRCLAWWQVLVCYLYQKFCSFVSVSCVASSQFVISGTILVYALSGML